MFIYVTFCVCHKENYVYNLVFFESLLSYAADMCIVNY